MAEIDTTGNLAAGADTGEEDTNTGGLRSPSLFNQ